jgi:hypothetical protein
LSYHSHVCTAIGVTFGAEGEWEERKKYYRASCASSYGLLDN